MSWTPPADTSLSTEGVSRVVAGLRDAGSRDDALAFLDTVADPGLLYVIACKVAVGRHDQPRVGASADGLRNYIRNRV